MKDQFYNYRKEAEEKIKELQNQVIEYMTLFRRIELGRQNMSDVVTQTAITG